MAAEQSRRLLSPSEVADLAQKSRSLVSSWRANPDSGFPEPVAGTAARPLFDADAIETWLIGQGYQLSPKRHELAFWGVLNGMRGLASTSATTDAAMTMVIARWLGDQGSDLAAAWSRLGAELRSNPVEALVGFLAQAAEARADARELLGDLRDILAVPDARSLVAGTYPILNACDGDELAALCEELLRRQSAALIKQGGEHGFVDSPTASVLAELARGHRGTIYDPACGIAEAIFHAIRLNSGPTRAIGHDINVDAVRVARRRAALLGVEANFTAADVIVRDPQPDLRADVVVAEPPYGLKLSTDLDFTDPRWAFGFPGRTADMAWIQHCLHHVAPGGSAYVVTTTAPASAPGPDGAIRAGLLRQGCVEAVVVLPPRFLPSTATRLCVWSLRRPGESRRPAQVLLVDATDAGHLTGIADWIADPTQCPAPNVDVAVADVLAQEANLTPARWIAEAALNDRDVEADHTRASADLAAAMDALSTIPAGPSVAVGPPTPDLLTVRTLADLAIVTVQRGRTILSRQPGSADPPPMNVLTPKRLRDGKVQRRRPLQPPPRRGGTSPQANAVRTEVGDVLVAESGELVAVVDPFGGWELQVGVWLLRPDPSVVLPHYLQACLSARWNERHVRGSAVDRRDVEAFEVPLVPLAEQQHIVAELDRLQQIQNAARKADLAAASLTEATLDRLRKSAEASRSAR